MQKRKPKAGTRAPDAPIINVKGQQVYLFDKIYEQVEFSWNWALLIFDGRNLNTLKNYAAIKNAVAKWPFINISVILAKQPSTPVDPALQNAVYFDFDGVAHAAYGLDGVPAIVLIRPDGHIAFRTRADEADSLLPYCNKVFK